MAEGSVGVILENDQVISNYVGTISGSGTAAVGESVSTNMVTGNSQASVTDSTITAKGNTAHAVTTNSKVADGAIVDSIVSEDSVNAAHNLKDNRQTETNRGLVVDSSSTHNLRSLVVTAGGSKRCAGRLARWRCAQCR